MRKVAHLLVTADSIGSITSMYQTISALEGGGGVHLWDGHLRIPAERGYLCAVGRGIHFRASMVEAISVAMTQCDPETDFTDMTGRYSPRQS